MSKNLDKAKERRLRFAFKTIAAPAPALNQLSREKLAVRLGVPVHAEIVTKAAVPATADMPARAEVKDLQWSIPPTLTTIIKLD